MDQEYLRLFFRPETLVFLIPTLAILVGGIIAIMKIVIHHRERMTMIEHGIHPDYPPDELPEDDGMGQ